MFKKIQHWWATSSRFEHFKDAYAISETAKLLALRQAIERRLTAKDLVIVLAHFPTSFTAIQDFLAEQQLDYQVCSRPPDDEWLWQHASRSREQILLVMAETLPELEERLPARRQPIPVSAMAVERYPLPSRDARIIRYFQLSSFPTRLGYFLSMDDPTLRAAVNVTTLTLLKQLGMNEHDLITSSMVAKRMNVVLTRLEKGLATEIPTDSSAEWWIKNVPDRPGTDPRPFPTSGR